MGQADLAGAGPAPAAHQPGMADGVVGRAEGARAHQRLAVGQRVGHGVDARDVQRFAERQAGQDGGQRPRQQRLARARRPLHQTVVAAGAGDLQRPLGLFLPLDIGKVDGEDGLVALVEAQGVLKAGDGLGLLRWLTRSARLSMG